MSFRNGNVDAMKGISECAKNNMAEIHIQKHTETHRNTQKHTETHRNTQKPKDRQKQTETDRDRQRQTEKNRDRQRQTETDTSREYTGSTTGLLSTLICLASSLHVFKC